MIILGIESSCDETGISLVESTPEKKTLNIISNVVSTSLNLHAKTGGIIPEIAAREQIKYIIPSLKKALLPLDSDFKKSLSKIDAIAVTHGPGLIGSLLVGLETARTLSFLSNKPLIPVNHLYGHIYANWLISQDNEINDINQIEFPSIALVVSGGHTDLVLLVNDKELKVIGSTRDDAAGEAFDKIGRLLGFTYPAGPQIAEYANYGNEKEFTLPRPMIGTDNFDFSFSGLKTAILNLIKKNNWNFTDPDFTKNNQKLLFDISASVQFTIIDVLCKKTIKAAKKYQVKSILLGGGVSANIKLRDEFEMRIKKELLSVKFFKPAKNLCTDNGAMIAASAFFHNLPVKWKNAVSNPELYY